MSQPPLPSSEVLAGLLALGMLKPDEARAVEPLLAQDALLRGRVGAWQKAVADVGLPAEPGLSADAWTRLEQQIRREAEQRALLALRYPEIRDEAVRLVALLRILLRRLREARRVRRLAMEVTEKARLAAGRGGPPPSPASPSGSRSEDVSP